jgi:hypothetical protein
MFPKQRRNTNDNEAFGWRWPHRDHVDLHKISETYRRMEIFFDLLTPVAVKTFC